MISFPAPDSVMPVPLFATTLLATINRICAVLGTVVVEIPAPVGPLPVPMLPPLWLTVLLAIVTLIEPKKFMSAPLIAKPTLEPIACTRSKIADTVVIPWPPKTGNNWTALVTILELVLELLETTVSEMLNTATPAGDNERPSLVKPRITQFCMLSVPRLLKTIPLSPTPPPTRVRPRRLTTSLAPVLMLIAFPAVTVTPASPTPSLMMLIDLVIATAP